MKFTACCLLALATMCFYCQTVRADAKSDAQAACFKEHKLTAAEMERVKSDQLITKENKTASKTLQCFLHCYYKKLGTINADNSYKYETISATIFEWLKGDQKRVAALMAKCKPVSTAPAANECERTFNYEVCLYDL